MPVGIKTSIDMASVNKVKQQHKDLIKELTDFTNSNPIKFKFDDATKGFKGLDDGFKQVTNSNNNFSTSMGHAIKRVGEYALAIGGVYGAIQQVKEGFETFSDIDTKISNISMITGMDKSHLQEQSKLWNKTAVEMKTTTENVADSMEEWLRAGKSIDEANEYLKTNIQLSKIAGESNSDVAQKLIKIGNAYGHSAKNTELFANKIAYLDTETSTSTNALLRSANGVAEIGKQAKVSEDYMLSMIATIQERSGKAPEAVARSIRGIIQDLTKVTNAQDEEGKKALSKFEAVMAKQNIAIRKSATEFKSGEEIIKSMASKWKDFDDVTKRTIQQLAGGKTFSEEFNILMNEQNRVLDLNNQLKDVGASLQDKYTKATDNVKDSTQQLKAKMEGLWLSLLDSIGLQNVIGEIGHLVDILKYLTVESPKTGLAFAAMVGTVIFAIKNFTAFTKVLEETVFFFKMLPLALSTSGGLVELLAIQFKGLTAVLTTLTMTPAGAIFMVLASAVAVATTVISEHVRYQEDLAEKTKQTKQVVEDLDKAMQSLNEQQISLNLDKMNEDFKKLDELKKKKDELQKRMNEWTLNPKEIINRVFPVNAFELRDLNKEISLLETVMKNGGETTEKYAQANDKLLQMKVADSVKEQCQEEIKHTEALNQMKDAVIPLYEEYNNLNNVKEKDSIQTTRMTTLATQLKEKIGANTKAIDENGNVILENNELVGTNIKMLSNEGVTIESLTQLRLDMMKQNATVQANMTTDTYNNVTARVKLMKSEFDAVGSQAEELRTKWKDGTISDEDRKQLESMDRYLMSRGNSIGNFNNALAEVDKIYSISKKGNYDTSNVAANHIPTDLGEKEKRDKKELEDLRLKIEGTRELSEKVALVDAQLSKINFMKDSTDNEKDKIELTKQQIELLRQKSQILDESYNKQQEEIKASKKLLESQGFRFNQQGLIENEEKLIELQNYANNCHGEERERQQTHVKNIKSEIDNVYYKLLNSTSQNRVQWQQLQTEARKFNREIRDIGKTMKTELVDKLDKVYEKALFGEDGLEAYERNSKHRVEAINEEIKALEKRSKSETESIQDEIKTLEEKWELEKQNEEYAEKTKEISNLKRKLSLMDLEALKSLSEEETKRLGLEQEREKVLEHNKEIAELELKLKNLNEQKNVQTLKKQEDGSWNFEYVADTKEIEKIEKEIKDKKDKFNKDIKDSIYKLQEDLKRKEEEFSNWEIENARKTKIKQLQEEIEYIENSKQLKVEQLQNSIEHIEKDLELKKEYFENLKKLTKENYDKEIPGSITNVVDTAMSYMSDTSKSKFKDVAKSIEDSVKNAKNEIDDLISKMNEIPSADVNINTNPSSTTSFTQLNGNWEHDTKILDNIQRFDTGGMAHVRNTDGGLAIVDDKELILEKDDTKNVLDTVKFTNKILDKIQVSKNILEQVRDIFQGDLIQYSMQSIGEFIAPKIQVISDPQQI